jgi:transcriptional regulator with XRE-family HTH domain
MRSSVEAQPAETTGRECATSCQTPAVVETAGKTIAIDCLAAAIDGSLVPRKVLADECGMSEGYFSKVARGEQGDFLGLVYRLRADIRRDFAQRLAAAESADPEELAAEQLAAAAIQFLKLRGVAIRMARANDQNRKRKVA